MHELAEKIQRSTATDRVFDQLHQEIVTLDLLPKTKLSEVEIAKRFGISRQPVRDAFNRLEHLGLLLIQPQKATEVRGFSMQGIAQARFVRLAVELEVIRQACAVWDKTAVAALNENLDRQQQALNDNHPDQFHTLDLKYHKLICELGGSPLAYDMIEKCKQKVDRLCALSQKRENEVSSVLEDHQQLAQALESKSTSHALKIIRRHLSRLDDTIKDIHQVHADYFE